MSDQIIASVEYDAGRSFVATLGNLLEQHVDAIVNAANGHLAHGGGVARAIAMAAGSALEDEGHDWVREHGPIPTGGAAVTTAGALPFKGVIHAVGPSLGQGDEEIKLVSAMKSAFQCAEDKGWSSLAFPAVSSGIFAVPLDVCARAYRTAADEFFAEHPSSSLRSIRLVVFDGPIVEHIRAAMS